MCVCARACVCVCARVCVYVCVLARVLARVCVLCVCIEIYTENKFICIL